MTGRHDDHGTITLWVLGLALCLLFLGGISLDLWRTFAVRQRLAETADAAAIAGATALDEPALRTTGTYQLDPRAARTRAANHLANHPDAHLVTTAAVTATPDAVTVQVEGNVHYTLLRIFLHDDPFHITVTATATPVRGTP